MRDRGTESLELVVRIMSVFPLPPMANPRIYDPIYYVKVDLFFGQHFLGEGTSTIWFPYDYEEDHRVDPPSVRSLNKAGRLLFVSPHENERRR